MPRPVQGHVEKESDVLDGPLGVVTFVVALGCGLVGGVFFAFSTFIMAALARLPVREGIAAMQAINVTVITPPFMLALFGTGLACLVLAGYSLVAAGSPDTLYLLTGGLLYFLGNVVVTIVFNVPRNNALAAAEPASADGARVWADYLVTWTRWNHIRTATALAAAAVFMVALVM
jgi:uncharacterized membrane protein